MRQRIAKWLRAAKDYHASVLAAAQRGGVRLKRRPRDWAIPLEELLRPECRPFVWDTRDPDDVFPMREDSAPFASDTSVQLDTDWLTEQAARLSFPDADLIAQLKSGISGNQLQGQRVVVSALLQKPELNGATGKAMGFDAAKGRYSVLLDTAATISLKPANLSLEPFRSSRALYNLCTVRLVCSHWQSLSEDDVLWSRICKARFGLETKTPPPRATMPDPTPLSTYREAARAWMSLCSE